jgi:cell division protein FtsW (lipid II flippase)
MAAARRGIGPLALAAIPALLPLLGLAQLSLGEGRPFDLLSRTTLIGGAFMLLLIAGSLAGARRHGDRTLFPLAMALAGVGMVVAVRLDAAASIPDVALRQIVAVGLGVAAFAIAANLPSLDWLRRYKYTWLAVTLLLMAATAAVGQEVNGARLWLALGPLRFQPSELAKVTLVVFLAGYVADRGSLLAASWRLWVVRLPPLPYLAPAGLAAAAAMGILLIQNDLGSALLLFGIVVAMLWIAVGDIWSTAAAAVLFAVAAWLSLRFVPRVGIRLQNWLDPWVWPQGAGYQHVQSEFALASGGLFGVGLGRGRPDLVPDVRTDFVLSAVGEELGLLTTAALACLFLLLFVRGMRIGLQAEEPFARTLAVGLSVAIALQAIIIAAGVVRLIPLTGLPLPFVSYGGSSLLINFGILGLLVRLSRSERDVSP